MKYIIALALVSYAFAAMAEPYVDYFVSGNKLHEWCIPPRAGSQIEGKHLCKGYVLAGYDYLVFGKQARRKQQLCVPKAVTSRQLVDVVTKYLVEHPKKRQIAATTLVVDALRKAWPCP